MISVCLCRCAVIEQLQFLLVSCLLEGGAKKLDSGHHGESEGCQISHMVV